MNRAGLGQNLTMLDLVALNAAQQSADVVARFRLIQQLVEHFHAGNDGRLRLVHQADDDFNRVGHLDRAAFLDTTGGNSAAARDGEQVLVSSIGGNGLTLAIRN